LSIFLALLFESILSLTKSFSTISFTEHRNMPVDDAVSLIGRSFDAYQLTKREKEATAARPAPTSAVRAPPPFVPPSQDILYLLNLLADKRQLSVDELGKVITYLTDRRDKLLESEGRLPKSYPSSKYY
jgi:radial spoke head protein 4A